MSAPSETVTDGDPGIERRPGRPRDARAERALLEAALDLAVEHGVDAVTVDAVAHRAKVSKATLYRRWKSKEAMLLDAWEMLHTDARPDVAPDTGTLEGDLSAMADLAAGHLEDPRALACLPDLLAAARINAELRPVADRLLLEKTAMFVQVLQRAIDRGEISPDTDVDLAHDLLFGPTFFRIFTGKPVEQRHLRVAIRGLLSLLRDGVLRD